MVVDELSPLARVSGFKEINRRSVFHTLNQKQQQIAMLDEIGKKLSRFKFNSCSYWWWNNNRLSQECEVVDVNDGLGGEGPFTPKEQERFRPFL